MGLKEEKVGPGSSWLGNLRWRLLAMRL